jgi:hypothetical protein
MMMDKVTTATPTPKVVTFNPTPQGANTATPNTSATVQSNAALSGNLEKTTFTPQAVVQGPVLTGLNLGGNPINTNPSTGNGTNGNASVASFIGVPTLSAGQTLPNAQASLNGQLNPLSFSSENTQGLYDLNDATSAGFNVSTASSVLNTLNGSRVTDTSTLQGATTTVASTSQTNTSATVNPLSVLSNTGRSALPNTLTQFPLVSGGVPTPGTSNPNTSLRTGAYSTLSDNITSNLLNSPRSTSGLFNKDSEVRQAETTLLANATPSFYSLESIQDENQDRVEAIQADSTPHEDAKMKAAFWAKLATTLPVTQEKARASLLSGDVQALKQASGKAQDQGLSGMNMGLDLQLDQWVDGAVSSFASQTSHKDTTGQKSNEQAQDYTQQHGQGGHSQKHSQQQSQGEEQPQKGQSILTQALQEPDQGLVNWQFLDRLLAS